MILNFQFVDTEDNELLSDIQVNWGTKQVNVKNYGKYPVLLPFGVKQNPTYKDFVELLYERCVPRERSDIGFLLKEIGIERYDPLQIVLHTEGFMWEDKCKLIYIGDKSKIKHLRVT